MVKLVIIYGTGSHNTEKIADAIAIGSPNYRDLMMPTVQKFLNELADVDLSGKTGLAFGSYGWGLEAIQAINKQLTSYGVEMIKDLCIKRMPGEEELEICRRVGSLLACKINNKEVKCAA